MPALFEAGEQLVQHHLHQQRNRAFSRVGWVTPVIAATHHLSGSLHDILADFFWISTRHQVRVVAHLNACMHTELSVEKVLGVICAFENFSIDGNIVHMRTLRSCINRLLSLFHAVACQRAHRRYCCDNASETDFDKAVNRS